MYKLFIEKDASLVEINPLAEVKSPGEPRLICLDAKINIDENADFRQEELFSMRDPEQEDPREVLASRAKLNYIGLDGSIGCLGMSPLHLSLKTSLTKGLYGELVKTHRLYPFKFHHVSLLAIVESLI